MSRIERLLGIGAAIVVAGAALDARANCNTAMPESTPTSAFTLGADGTATDRTTGLMWKRCAEGQTWNGSTCTGQVATFGWQGALQQAARTTFAGHSDWRLPNVKELYSIVSENCFVPSINTVVFPAASQGTYWTGSPAVKDGSLALVVDFADGGAGIGEKTMDQWSARLVRGGPSSSSSASFTSAQGLWWNPAESGWGISFAHQGDIVFASWFTYDQEGRPWWLVADLRRTADGTYAGDLSTAAGPRFGSIPFGPAPVETKVGAMTVTFAGAESGSVAYTVNGIAQTKAIVPQLFGPRPACAWGAQSDLTLASNYTDLWWNATEPGWGVSFAHQGDVVFATWLTYDGQGRPQWMIAVLGRSAPGVYTGSVSSATGPAFNALPWDPGRIVETPVGTATVTFAHGNSASFAYTVGGVTQTKAISRQVFAQPGTVCR